MAYKAPRRRPGAMAAVQGPRARHRRAPRRDVQRRDHRPHSAAPSDRARNIPVIPVIPAGACLRKSAMLRAALRPLSARSALPAARREGTCVAGFVREEQSRDGRRDCWSVTDGVVRQPGGGLSLLVRSRARRCERCRFAACCVVLFGAPGQHGVSRSARGFGR